MGKPLSAAMLDRAKQVRSNLGGGRVVSMKDFVEAEYRCLPVPPDKFPPGVKYVKVHCNSIKKHCTSPLTFGNPCPCNDKIGELKQGLSREDAEAVGDIANLGTERWMHVVPVKSPGTPEKLNVVTLPMKLKPYRAFVDYVTDDQGDDVTDVEFGRSFKYKKNGTGRSAEYVIVKWSDSGPASSDPKMRAAYKKAGQTMDPAAEIEPVDWAVLEEIYGVLSGGESIPDKYYEASGVKRGAKGKPPVAAGKRPVTRPPVVQDAQDDEGDDQQDDGGLPGADVDDAQPAADDAGDTTSTDDAGVGVGTRVSFDDADGVTQLGSIVEVGDADADGDVEYKVEVDADGETYGVYGSLLTVLPPEDAPAETEAGDGSDGGGDDDGGEPVAEAPEEVEPAPAPPPKVPTKTPAKAAATAPKAPAAGARPSLAPKAAPKAPAAAPKPAAAKAPAPAAAKPGVKSPPPAAGKAPASAGIRSRMPTLRGK